MITFKELREATKVVFNKKMMGVPVVISKTDKGYETKIDGDVLDTFKTQDEAEKSAETVIKELK